MFVLTFLFIWTACLLMFEPVSSQKDSQEVTAKPGKNATLPCRGPRDASITLLKWNRADRKSDYVFFFRDDNNSYEHFQHPSFRGRVQLRDPEMKDGDVSVMLKNVTINDTGTYECRVSVTSSEDSNNVSSQLSQLMVTNTDVIDVTLKAGEDVPLSCRGPRDAAITLLEWRRLDLESDKHVFFFREKHEHFQHPSFRGRVQLRDPEMKDGDASVVLKNVTINDTGTYECRVSAASSGDRETRHFIKLQVTGPGLTAGHTEDGGNKEGGDKDGNVGLKVGLPVGVLLVVGGVVGFMIFRNRRRRPENNSYQPPAGEEADQQQEIPMDSLDRQQL